MFWGHLLVGFVFAVIVFYIVLALYQLIAHFFTPPATKQEGSYFDGGFWALVGWSLLGVLVCLITLGIAFPWVYCWIIRWRINHTVVEGKRLEFNGTGGSLFVHFILRGWLLGLLLMPLTLGLYPFYYLTVSLRKWETKNTSFLTGKHITNTADSCFDGRFWALAGWSLLGVLVCLITLGIAFPWVYCWIIRWRINHTVVEGKRLEFNGTGGSLFVHFILRGWLLGLLLIPLTLGLYPFYYLAVSLEKWEIKNTSFSN